MIDALYTKDAKIAKLCPNWPDRFKQNCSGIMAEFTGHGQGQTAARATRPREYGSGSLPLHRD
jgi:hypothetical protein